MARPPSGSPSSSTICPFNGSLLRGPTDFQAAAIFGEADFSDTADDLDRFVLTGLSPGASITFANVTAPSLEMNLDLLDDVDGQLVKSRCCR